MATTRDAEIAALARDRGEELTRYAYLLTGDLAAAQDLLQDALVRVFVRTRTGFDPEVLEAYVRRSIVNLYIDGHRKRRTWAKVQHLFVDDEARAGHEAASADRVALREALATLGRQERAAVVLRYFEDVTVPEVADRMRIAEGTVKRYLSNAVRRLEQRLGPLPSPPDDVRVLAAPSASRTTSTTTERKR